MTLHVVLVANAAAGAAERDQVEAACGALGAAATVESVSCESPRDLDAAIADLGDRVLVVAGGDGSLHLAVERLDALAPDRLASTSIGLIPLGTGNDFARGVGLPLDPVEAARAVLDGEPRPVDLLRTDGGHVVVNASHAGLGAVAAERAVELKARFGPVAYPLGALLAGAREEGRELTVTLDGEVLSDGATLMVGVANGPSIGGGTLLAPGAMPDDGLLDVVVVTAVGPVARVAFGAALKAGTHLERDDVRHARGHEVRIAGDPVPHDLDGEYLEPVPSLTYTMDPAAWRLLLPPGRSPA